MNGKLTRVTPKSVAPVLVLDTTDNPSVVRRAREILQPDELEVIGFNDVRQTNDWEALSRVRFVLGEWSGDPSAPLRTTFKLAAVHLLPVLVIGDEAPTASDLEALRSQGMSAFVGDRSLETAVPVARELLRSTQWFSGQLDRVSLPDTLQILSTAGRSGLLVLACPHCRPLSFRPWQETLSTCLGDDRCPGAVARLYLRNGQPTHAETSTDQGLSAFASCMKFVRGVVRFCEVFLPPGRETLEGSASHLLIRAAALTDEATRAARMGSRIRLDLSRPSSAATAARRSQPPALPRAAAPRLVVSESQLLQSVIPDAALVVHADSNGGVLDTAGTGDSEGLAAVAAITSHAFEQVVQKLGLGVLEGWTLAGNALTCVAANEPHQVAAALVGTSKDSFKQLERFIKHAKKTTGGDK